jgi:hypothetical protein
MTRRIVAVTGLLPSIVLGALLTASPVAAACGGVALQNGGFETPGVPVGGQAMFDASQVPPWQTTDSLGQIEIWGDGFLGVPAAQGGNFAEINANSPGTLYQDVASTSGEVMTWSLVHRGRDGDDTMHVLIGDATVADVNSDTGWDFISGDFTDGNTAWGAHTGQYTVPAGHTCTRFAFRAVSTAGGNPSVGNFLDAVRFSVAVPPTPTPTPPPTDAERPALPANDTTPDLWLTIAVLLATSVVTHRLIARRTSD